MNRTRFTCYELHEKLYIVHLQKKCHNSKSIKIGDAVIMV